MHRDHSIPLTGRGVSGAEPNYPEEHHDQPHPAARAPLPDRAPAARRSLAALADTLEKAGARLAAADTPRNRDQLRHIIGLERWGQRRLRVALGEPPARDEMDAYQPSADMGMGELREAFATTRRETVALARELAASGADPGLLIDHNQLGPLTARGWLAYLNTYAGLEGMRLR